jgi:pyruvate dehydrogenase E2 component (dihydrolipoamide acetyltransferase)
MATQVVMPKLSPTMEEGQLSRWLKKEGDTVSVGEPLAEVDTDKATMEAQALTSGVLRKILVQEGETVPLGEVIAIIGAADEDISSLAGGTAKATETASTETEKQASAPKATEEKKETASLSTSADKESNGGATIEVTTTTTPPPAAAQQESKQTGDGRMIVSPLAARMAAESGINLRSLTGSGPGGRIVKRDIEAAINAANTRPSQPTQAATQTPEAMPQPRGEAQQTSIAPSTQIEGAPAYRESQNSPMRRTIAQRLTQSLGPVPHFFLTTEIEMDSAAEMRRKLNEINPELKISINDFIIKVAAVALMEHPQVNASFQDRATRHYERADIGVAVALEDGLITPVVRGANQKSIGQISREVRELAERARNRQLKPEEYTGATFSVSNLGMFGITEFTAIINPPEAAILAVGAMQTVPVVRDGNVTVRQMMRVTMSCDHRIVDGATGAKFLQTFKKLLENPLLLLI